MRYRPGKSVKASDHDDIKSALVSVLHHPVQLGSGILFARDPFVYIHTKDFKPTPLTILFNLGVWTSGFWPLSVETRA
jgi:hypothetical protein